MRSTPSPTTGSRTAGYVLCVALVAPVLPLIGFFALGIVASPVSVAGLGVLVMALCIGAVWLLREREWQRDADS
ncbi:hypothetical protein [Nocardioides mangrovi]|uniref:Uncharacterized protein n=1 Tax=Nocardioides mangrovi TaxID=2874580 RepID=A0ABS7UCN1_9ACTN|nr:hypothetical protein [Nocardioides mangrovi]MBZ5738753.1 hypothetical protein [Nocardioides mangrovi]